MSKEYVKWSVLLYVHRNHRCIRDGNLRTSSSTFTEILSSVCEMKDEINHVCSDFYVNSDMITVFYQIVVFTQQTVLIIRVQNVTQEMHLMLFLSSFLFFIFFMMGCFCLQYFPNCVWNPIFEIENNLLHFKESNCLPSMMYTTRWVYKWQTLQACSCSQWHNHRPPPPPSPTLPSPHPSVYWIYTWFGEYVFYFWIYLLLQHKFTSDLLIPIYQVIWCMDKFTLFAHVIVVMSSLCVFIIWSIRCTYCFMLHMFAHGYILTCMKNHTRLCFIIKEEKII